MGEKSMLKNINKMLEEAVQNGAFPGCNFAIVKKDGIFGVIDTQGNFTSVDELER